MHYVIVKEMKVHGAHNLDLPYESPCNKLHGHTYKFELTVEADELNENNMVIDFTTLKNLVFNTFNSENDHVHFNTKISVNPTAEKIGEVLLNEMNRALSKLPNRPKLTSVIVWETENNACKVSL